LHKQRRRFFRQLESSSAPMMAEMRIPAKRLNPATSPNANFNPARNMAIPFFRSCRTGYKAALGKSHRRPKTWKRRKQIMQRYGRKPIKRNSVSRQQRWEGRTQSLPEHRGQRTSCLDTSFVIVSAPSQRSLLRSPTTAAPPGAVQLTSMSPCESFCAVRSQSRRS
jgi:hypothetical protein